MAKRASQHRTGIIREGWDLEPARRILLVLRLLLPGSSREQAATSILARDIPIVIAGSLGNIFSRNSINNVLVSLEIPHLVERLRESQGRRGEASDSPHGLEASVGCPPLQGCDYGEGWHRLGAEG